MLPFTMILYKKSYSHSSDHVNKKINKEMVENVQLPENTGCCAKAWKELVCGLSGCSTEKRLEIWKKSILHRLSERKPMCK